MTPLLALLVLRLAAMRLGLLGLLRMLTVGRLLAGLVGIWLLWRSGRRLPQLSPTHPVPPPFTIALRIGIPAGWCTAALSFGHRHPP